MTETKPALQPELLDAFDRMVAGVPGVERRGATTPYVALNGNTYAMISRAGSIGLRLPADDLGAFLAAYNARPFEGVPGFVTKEYAAIPPSLLGDTRTLQTWFKLSYAYASRLPPKLTALGRFA